jgi:hypothetical protein
MLGVQARQRQLFTEADEPLSNIASLAALALGRPRSAQRASFAGPSRPTESFARQGRAWRRPHDCNNLLAVIVGRWSCCYAARPDSPGPRTIHRRHRRRTGSGESRSSADASDGRSVGRALDVVPVEMGRRWKESAEARSEVDIEPGPVLGGWAAEELREVFTNLLMNALGAARGGRLVFGLSPKAPARS